MKLVKALQAVCIASLIAAAGCGGEQEASEPLRAQVDDSAEADGGADHDGGDHHDAGMSPAGMDAGSDDAEDASAPRDPACEALTYREFGEPFFEKYCVSCHLGSEAPAGVDLSTLAGVREHAEHVVRHAVEEADPSMPPEGARQPSAAERAKLGTFLGCGPR